MTPPPSQKLLSWRVERGVGDQPFLPIWPCLDWKEEMPPRAPGLLSTGSQKTEGHGSRLGKRGSHHHGLRWGHRNSAMRAECPSQNKWEGNVVIPISGPA